MPERTDMPELPPLGDVAAEAARLQLAMAAPELHGATCGWLAGGGDPGPGWLGKVMADDAQADPPEDGALARLMAASRAQLEDNEFGFELLLPAGGASLDERSGALFDWCRGFLGAFGLAAGADPKLSEVGAEALADLARLAMASPEGDGDEEDEQALAEIEEFVRVATLLLHGDCVLAGRHRRSLH